MIGPPALTPNWLRLNGDCGAGGWLKKLRESSASSRKNSKPSPCSWLLPERVATLTIAPELRPYSALNVELSTLNSDTVLIDGWNVTCEFDRSFRLIPLTMKFTEVSRLPAVMNENAPWPRSGALSPAFCGDVEPPGISGPRSTKCRPFNGISWTVFSAIDAPTATVA